MKLQKLQVMPEALSDLANLLKFQNFVSKLFIVTQYVLVLTLGDNVVLAII